MYETYYGFSQPPFGLTPDVRFCYQHRSYTRAKAYMEYAVMREEGFLVVTGRPGMGKTTLIQDLLAELGSEHRLVARIDSTQLDADDLLRLVTYAFGLPAKGLDKATLLHSLGDFLRRRRERAGTAILIVDEAQNLPDRSLEELRLITNLQQGARALIQIFLVGQESLREIIRQPNLEQLQQRVVAACHLEPLDLVETRAYIRHRLLCAGWSGDPVFEAEALRLIYQASGGVPRLINKVCDRLLLYGSVDDLHTLTGEESRLVIAEFRGEFLESAGGEPSETETLGSREGEAAEIEDLVWEPDMQAPPEAQPSGEDAARGPGGPANRTATMPGGNGGTGSHQIATEPETVPYEPPAAEPPPSAPAARGNRDATSHPPGQSPARASASDAQDLGSNRPRGLGLAPDAASGSTALLLVAESLEQEIRAEPYPAGQAQGARRSGRRWILPYAATAAMLLGIGSLLVVLQYRSPGQLAGQIDQIADSVSEELKRISRATDADQESRIPIPLPSPDPGTMIPATSEPDAAPRMAAATAGDATALDRRQGGASGETPGERLTGTMTGELGPAPGDITPSESRPPDRQVPEAAGDSDALGSAPVMTQFSDPAILPDARDSDLTAPLELSPPGSEPREVSIDPASPLAGQGLGGVPDDDGGSEGAGISVAPAEPLSAGVLPGAGDMPQAMGDGSAVSGFETALRDLGLRVQRLGDGRLSLDLAQEIPFALGSARLPNQATQVLQPLAGALLRYPDLRVTLVGHTDDSGPASYNRRLSLARARAVEDYLQQQGVLPSRITSQGMGDAVPLPDENAPAAERHRRVEVIVEPTPR